MGIYPLTPGHPSYVLTSPEFDAVRIDVPGRKSIQISARGNSEKNVYVRSRTVNGNPWTKAWISHTDLVNGAKIATEMSAQPRVRKLSKEELPYSAKTELDRKIP